MTEDTSAAKILIVEDEALIAREIQRRLTNMGWEVVGMAFGEEAVQLAVDTQPDLLLSDIHLKHGLSGIDVAQRIQGVVDLPVVFLTAYSDPDTVSQAKAATPFGYIIKPVENRELQITIEMALYKFRIEKELRESQQLLQNALACIGNALIFINEKGQITNINQEARDVLGISIEVGSEWRTVLAVNEQASVAGIVAGAVRDKSIVKIPPFLLQRVSGVTKLVDGIVGPMDEGAVLILRDLGDIEDPVEMLQAPLELLSVLGADQLSPSESSFCQLLISPDDTTQSETAEVVEQVRSQLDSSLRATDLASVFAGSMVLVSLPYTDVGEGERIARTLLEQLGDFSYQGKAVTFSGGLADSTAGDQEPIELFRRATSALDMARRSGGNRLWIYRDDRTMEAREIQGGGEYRHVVLLWNVMNALANANDISTMCDEFCRHLSMAFQSTRAAILDRPEESLQLVVAYVSGARRTTNIEDVHLSAAEFLAVDSLFNGDVTDAQVENTLMFSVADRYAVLVSGDQLSASDMRFFRTLGTYFASSLARFERAPAPAVEPPEDWLVYESSEISQVLATADLAAPTDATVLLTGESGTGKELIARYIHEHGSRRDKPLIVVDCGAVAPGLIESELFGHVKGAFTGAFSNFKGRLKEADGATILLDEIAELPLDTQVKLLRFVQERQVAAVGSNQYESVDARVIAATNKDLKAMVEQGQFREDLYYRLNVFSILVPPLRDRKADILKIARYYLDQYAQRYKKQLIGFTYEAEQALLSYLWPGNVRELSNVINRAVILSKDSLISPIQLGLFASGEVTTPVARPTSTGWRQVVREIIELGSVSEVPKPVGRYLEEDFILTSIVRHDGVLNRAALTIGVPESTLRRRVQKIEQAYQSSDPVRPDDWPATADIYEDVMRVASAQKVAPLYVLSSMMVEELEQRKLSKSVCAQLLGVSLPTYRKLLGEVANIS